MKKIISLFLALALLLTAAAALAESGEDLKLGLSIDTTLSSSKDAEDADGLAQVDSTAVAVLVDAEGRIVDVDIDAAQTKMPFTTAGALGADFPAESITKRQLGDAYGMSAVSQIGDWDKQIAALSAFLIGKTADEVRGVAVDEASKPTDTELTAGCTMSVGGYLSAVATAMENAAPSDAQAGDKTGIGIVTSTSKSKDAQDEADGQAQAYSFYAAVAVDASGVVTACRIDSTQGNVTFDATGKITADTSARVQTKQELGEAYGMRGASGIGKEWFEQADAFAAYVIGKTAEQIEGIALDEQGKATDTELTGSVTVSAGDLKAAVLQAVAFATQE